MDRVQWSAGAAAHVADHRRLGAGASVLGALQQGAPFQAACRQCRARSRRVRDAIQEAAGPREGGLPTFSPCQQRWRGSQRQEQDELHAEQRHDGSGGLGLEVE